jgi:hypothetical protein
MEKKKEKAKEIYFGGKRTSPFIIPKASKMNGISKKEHTRKQLKKVYLEHIEAKKTLLMDTKMIPNLFKKRGYHQLEKEKLEKRSLKNKFLKRQKELKKMEEEHGSEEEIMDEEELILQQMEEEKKKEQLSQGEKEGIQEEKTDKDEQIEEETQEDIDYDKEFAILINEEESKIPPEENLTSQKEESKKRVEEINLQTKLLEESDDEEENSNRKFSKLKKIKQVREDRRKAREERKIQEKLRMKEINKKFGNHFYDKEAQVGSDNEENDHVIKQINKRDHEENEEGLDKDFDELIDKDFDQENEQYDQTAADRFHIEEMMRESEQLMNFFNKNLRKYQKEKEELEDSEKEKKKRLDTIKELFMQFTSQNGKR